MKRFFQGIWKNKGTCIFWIVLAWISVLGMSSIRRDNQFRDRFDKLEAEIKTYEAVKVLDAKQALESFRPPDSDPTPPDYRR
jgi:hypothetical protein